MRHHRTLLRATLALLLHAALPARAQSPSPLDAAGFHPAPGEALASTPTGRVLPHLELRAGAWLGWARNPVVIADRTGDVALVPVRTQVEADLWASLGLFQRFELDLVLPVLPYLAGDDLAPIGGSGAVSGPAVGDLRVAGRVQLVGDPRASTGFFLALAPELSLPTGNGAAFAGAGHVGGALGVAATRRWDTLAISAALTPRVRGSSTLLNVTQGSELQFAAGAEYAVQEALTAFGELAGAATMSGSASLGHVPLEARAGARLSFGDWSFPVGLGAGLTNGIGAADVRVFAGVAWRRAGPHDPDPDQDGILDAADLCPFAPEDRDGFEDADGCPDEDDDHDGVPDAKDRCPRVAGLAAFDGCPDRDADGVPDASDQCPAEPGLARFDGCPDDDGDGLPNAADKCPQAAEDRDRFEDEDGCPDPDNDRDGIPDERDACPNDPENVNGEKDDDGCPDEVKVAVTKDRIRLFEKVYFGLNSAQLEARSQPILDQVAHVLGEHPEVRKVRVEGHADDTGGDAFNLQLSQQRAEAVRTYLVAHGVAPERLLAEGFGSRHPLQKVAGLAGAELEAAREANRRVELIIVDDATGAVTP